MTLPTCHVDLQSDSETVSQSDSRALSQLSLESAFLVQVTRYDLDEKLT